MTKDEFALRVQNSRKDLYLAALSVVRNAEDAKDAVSEAVTIAWEKLDRLKDDGKFDGWLLKILYNEAKDIYKKNRQRNDDADLSDAFSYDAGIENVGFYDMLNRCGFDEKTMRILIMRFVYDMTLQRISYETGMQEATVKTKYYRALKKLSETEGLR